MKIKEIKSDKVILNDWIDGFHDCAVNLKNWSIVAFVTVDGVGEWCKVRDCTDAEKAEIESSIPQFVAEQTAKADRKEKAIAKARAIGLTEEEMPDYLIPAYWSDMTEEEIETEYFEEMGE